MKRTSPSTARRTRGASSARESSRPGKAGLSRRDRIHGCLLGGAVGDALGAPIEFFDDASIRRYFGKKGITDFVDDHGRLGLITDDTQMTLFTAEGLIRAWVRERTQGASDVSATVGHAYQRWLHTQGERSRADGVALDGWLIGERALWSRRAPGTTCLGALAAHGSFGDAAVNNSKGCGGVMRVAPVGFWKDAFALGCDVARLTHGHPSGYLAAGYLAELVAGIADGEDLRAAMARADAALAGAEAVRSGVPAAAETARAVALAREAAARKGPHSSIPRELGAGWVAEEALAIGLYCALVGADFERAVALAVNHGGDSDSTGSIAGQIVGALRGEAAIPARWRKAVELGGVIARLADDLAAVLGDPPPDPERLAADYPGH